MSRSGNGLLTIIPARSGSKGIPGKNIKPLAGKPLIHWIAHSITEAGNCGRVIVSTDSEEIAEIARCEGLEVPFLRPAEISKDLSTDLEFVIHALSFFKRVENWTPSAVARFSPVTPLVPPEVIHNSVEMLLGSPEADSVRPVYKVSHHPYKSWVLDGEYLKPAFTELITNFKEPHNLPRQLFPEMYAHLGASGVAWTDTILKKNSTSGDKVKFFLMDGIGAVDINNDTDFYFAEYMMTELRKSHVSS